MKKSFIKFSLIAFVFSVLTANMFGQVKKTPEKIVEPTAKEAIKQIIVNGALPLKAVKDCASVKTAPEDRTILDFLSGVLSFQAMPDSTNNLEFTFKQEKGRMGETVWVCDLLFKGKDSQDIWSNGFRFKMRNSTRKLMRETLSCIGAG